MKSNYEYRALALSRIRRVGWTNLVLATLIVVAISALSQFVGYVALLVAILLSLPLSYTYDVAFLRFVRTDNNDAIPQLFSYFNSGMGRAIAVPLLMGIFVWLWTLLLIIPGIIMSLAYAMSNFVAADHPELDAVDCIRQSREIMKGHKWQLFCLNLSFLGWAILCVFTLGIGVLWLAPYKNTSMAEFYQDILRERGELIEDNDDAAEAVAE